MKETIFTRHYQTVLSMLPNNRKDFRQLTSHLSIDSMKDNRVLNNRPPPINDEELLLSRRKRTTLCCRLPTPMTLAGWVHSKCSGLQNAAEYRRIKDWVCSSCNSPHTLPKTQPLPTSIPTQAGNGNSFTIMQFNANGIGNKPAELGEFLKRHNVKVAVIQESKLSSVCVDVTGGA